MRDKYLESRNWHLHREPWERWQCMGSGARFPDSSPPAPTGDPEPGTVEWFIQDEAKSRGTKPL